MLVRIFKNSFSLSRVAAVSLGASAIFVAPISVADVTVPPASSPAAPAGARVTLDPAEFPCDDELKPVVAFWTHVFGDWTSLQSAVHSSDYPDKVFTVLDFRDDAQRMGPVALELYRNKKEKAALNQINKLLREVNALRHTPEKLDPEQKRIYDLFSDQKSDRRFLNAVGTFRIQRGIRERTGQALLIAGKYLPEMEATFRQYGLPPILTRLPLVESSFNVEAYSKVGAAGLWQFMPSSAKHYDMRLNDVMDDRRDPWASTDAAARHLRDDYRVLGSWPLAVTAYNHGRSGIYRGLKAVKGDSLMDLIDDYEGRSFGFASRNFYAEFLAAAQIEQHRDQYFPDLESLKPLKFDTVETHDYVAYATLRDLSGTDPETFGKLNPAYRPEVIDGKLYVPPDHKIRVPAGSAAQFRTAYAALGNNQLFKEQREYYRTHKVARGDTIGGIAHRYGVSSTSIAQANGLKSLNRIRIGQTLRIPPAHADRIASSRSTVVASANTRRSAESHVVRSGETLGGIADRYGISVAGLKNANDIGGGSLIKVGQQLRIPSARQHIAPSSRSTAQTHTVRSGDTLSTIARRYGVSTAQLKSVNDLSGSSLIRIGQRLRIPSG